MEANYQPNSDRSRQQNMQSKQPTKPVITAQVQKKKTGIGQFIANDVRTVGSYLWNDIFVPTVRRTISDLICNAVNMTFGQPMSRNYTGAQTQQSPYVNYTDRRTVAASSYQNNTYRVASVQYNYDNIAYQTLNDANQVLMAMGEEINNYGFVSVNKMCAFSGVSSQYTDEGFGWNDLSSARIEQLYDGRFMIRLPKPTYI